MGLCSSTAAVAGAVRAGEGAAEVKEDALDDAELILKLRVDGGGTAGTGAGTGVDAITGADAAARAAAAVDLNAPTTDTTAENERGGGKQAPPAVAAAAAAALNKGGSSGDGRRASASSAAAASSSASAATASTSTASTNQYKDRLKAGESNVLVAVRVRPMCEREIKRGTNVVKIIGQMVVVVDPKADSSDILRANRSRERKYVHEGEMTTREREREGWWS